MEQQYNSSCWLFTHSFSLCLESLSCDRTAPRTWLWRGEFLNRELLKSFIILLGILSIADDASLSSSMKKQITMPSIKYLSTELKFFVVYHFPCSGPEQDNLTWSPKDWAEWFLHRLHEEPWALGGLVVIGVFVLGTLSLVLFALLYGCCRGPEKKHQRKKKQRNAKDTMI